jgi:[acyl-carrier-protein] S-malonyltransferase
VVVAGGDDDIGWAVAEGRQHGIRRVIPLRVAGAFHSPLMEPAARRLQIALGAITVESPVFPVWSNATGLPHGDDVGRGLVDQLTSPVRFAESLQAMAEAGARQFVHIGPGDVTAGLARRSVKEAETYVVSSLDEAAAVADRLGATTGGSQ